MAGVTTRSRFRAVLWCALALLVAPSVEAQRFFPLDVGNVWTYEADRFSIVHRNEVLAVDDEGIASFARRTVDSVLLLQEDGDRIDLFLPDEGFVTFYRFDGDGFTRRDPFDCEDRLSARIVSRDETVETPAGVFRDCIQIDYEGGLCADAGLFSEWFAPDVGLVKWVENNFAGPVTYTLTSFENTAGTAFVRGDANESGDREIADAVFVLSFLFVGGRAPSCEKSADINGDEEVELSDAVYLLAFLFLGGLEPPAPFPECGRDNTGPLTCDSFRACAVE